MIMSGGWRPHERDLCSYKRDPTELHCPFHHVGTQWGSTVYELRGGPESPLRPLICWPLDLEFPASGTVGEKSLLLKSPPAPSLWYFVTATGTYWDPAGTYHHPRHAPCALCWWTWPQGENWTLAMPLPPPIPGPQIQLSDGLISVGSSSLLTC